MTRREIAMHLRDAGIEEAEAEAKLLFARASGMQEATMLAEPGADCSAPALFSMLARRKEREPLAYILGEAYFFAERYRVSPACLIPRPESEMLVEHLIAHLPRGGIFADLCTGSGCLSISVLCHRPDARAVAYDISEEALALAAENARENGVADRVTFLRRDLLRDTPAEGPFDILLSNPPYVTDEEFAAVPPELLYEPRAAFLGGADGLCFYRRFLADFGDCLKEGGRFVFEIGWQQGAALRALAEATGCPCRVEKDLCGRDRMAIITK